MMRKIRSLAVLSFAHASFAFAQPVFELSQLEVMAQESNRTLFAARNQVEAAQSAIETASSFPNPEIEYLSGSLKPRIPGGSTGNSQSTTLTQPLDLPWRRAPKIRLAEASLVTANAHYQIHLADLLARLRTRYFEILRRQAELKNAQEDKTLMENIRSRIALRVETGEAPRFELIKAETEALNAQKSAQAAEYRLAQARSQLRQAVGGALPPDFLIQGNLGTPFQIPPLNELRKQLVEKNPELALAKAEKLRSQHLLDFEKSQRFPSVALKATLDQDPEVNSSKFGIVVSIPLWDRRSGPVGEAAAQLSRAKNELEAQDFSLIQTLEIAYQQYQIAETQVNALESGIVRQAQAALKIAEAAYHFGERGFIEVLDAQRVYRAARSELITARYELAIAWVEIERLRASSGEKA